MISPLPIEGTVPPPLVGPGLPVTAPADLFEQLFANLTSEWARVMRSSASPQLPSRAGEAIPSVPEAEPEVQYPATLSMSAQALPATELADLPAPADALPDTVSRQVVANVPDPTGPGPEPTQRIEVLMDPLAISAMRQSGTSLDLELRPAATPPFPADALRRPMRAIPQEISQRFLPVTPERQRRGDVALLQRLDQTPKRVGLLTPVRPSTITVAIEPSKVPMDQSFAVPVLSPLKGTPARTDRKDWEYKEVQPSDPSKLRTAGIESRRPVIEPLGIAVQREQKGPDRTSVPVRTQAHDLNLPVEPSNPAAGTPTPQTVRTGEELLISKPPAPGDTAVRFVLEDWNPDAPVRSIRISLEPKDLGPLRITLFQRGGQVHARMTVENTEALHAVQAQTQALQSALVDRGVAFGTFSLTVVSAAQAAGVPAGPSLRPGLRADGEREPHGPEDDTEHSKEEVMAR